MGALERARKLADDLFQIDRISRSQWDTLDDALKELGQYRATMSEPGGISKLWEELQAYRALGEVEELSPIVAAHETGRLVVLPVATVFELVWQPGEECDSICPVSIDGIGCCSLCDYGKLIVVEQKCKQSHVDRIGRDVFLTREAAEAALAERERGRE